MSDEQLKAITIPDDKVQDIVDKITDYAINLVARHLPSDEAYEGFGEVFEAMTYEMVNGYSYKECLHEIHDKS